MAGRKADVPNTITDQQYAALGDRALKANPDWFSDKAVKQRKASAAQQDKAEQS